MKKLLFFAALTAGMLVSSTRVMAQGESCDNPIVIADDEKGVNQQITAAGTVWFQYNNGWAAPLAVSAFRKGEITDIAAQVVTKVVTRHESCDGAENESNALLSNIVYAKAGINLVAVTVSEPCGVRFAPQLTANCSNGAIHMPTIELDTEVSLVNAYYTEDRQIVIAEAGTYTVTLKHSEGSLLKVGKLVEGVCDFDTTPLQATVGADNEAVVTADFAAGDIIVIESDSYGALEGGQPSVKIAKGAADGIQKTQAASREIALTGAVGTGHFSVSSFLLKDGAEVAVYDAAARKVFDTKSRKGEERVDVNLSVAPGVYLVVVYGKNRSASAQVIVK